MLKLVNCSILTVYPFFSVSTNYKNKLFTKNLQKWTLTRISSKIWVDIITRATRLTMKDNKLKTLEIKTTITTRKIQTRIKTTLWAVDLARTKTDLESMIILIMGNINHSERKIELMDTPILSIKISKIVVPKLFSTTLITTTTPITSFTKEREMEVSITSFV